jgi:ADP-ribosyl-[dinitrogen reductase] hydrolase
MSQLTVDRHLNLASRLAGAAWGHLVGDAVGVPYEFGPALPADEVVFGAKGTHHQPAGTWSDDGALMLALLDSLLDAGFDPEDQARRALGWYRGTAYTPDNDGRFDIGITTGRALRAVEDGCAAADAGPSDETACGNGSLMRILPVALTGRDLPAAELVEQAHLASRVTHGHPRCQVACAIYCLVVSGLLRGMAPADALAGALDEAGRLYEAADGHEVHREALEELLTYPSREGSGYVLDAFWSAWGAFAGAADYPDVVRRAIACGSDTDTTAAIAGGLAGAYWGWEAIPLEWRRGMRGRDVATPIIDRLVATAGFRTSTASPIRVDELDLAGTSLEGLGRAGITFLPGKKRDGWTGLHWRDLDADLAQLRETGVDALFLLVKDNELASCLVAELPRVMAVDGPELIRYPIHDPRTPLDPAGYRKEVQNLVDRVRRGEFVAIACRGGIDRSGMTAACLYREAGLGADEAIARTQAARRRSITIAEQQDFVRRWPWAAGE